MCGRFTAWAIARNWRDYGLTFESTVIPPPRYNAAPGQILPVALACPTAPGTLTLRDMRWGLLPHWAKDEKLGFKLVNARAETVASLPSFRDAFRHRRCLIPADGFYEWQTTEGGKQPFRFVPQRGGGMLFAGLWEQWRPQEAGTAAQPVETFTIVVCPASADVLPVHDRMPVILQPAEALEWLGEASSGRLQELLRPAPAGLLRRYPVSRAVGNVRNSGPELLEELTKLSLFD